MASGRITETLRIWRLPQIAVVLVLAMVASLVAEPEAEAATTTFADGTEVEVTIDSPADGSTPTAGAVTLEGTARVGAGDTVPDTSLVVVYDLSGSTLDAAGGDCGGDVNGDGRSNTILDCEIAAMEELERTAAALGSVSEMGVTLFELGSRAADVQPDAGPQRLTAPGADRNDNGTTDIAEVVRSSRWRSGFFSADATVSLFTRYDAGTGRGGTNYAAGLGNACETLAASSEPNRVVVFLSDGEANRGGDVTGVLPCSQPATVYSVAVGTGSSCTADASGRGSLQEIADLTGGTCTEVVSPEDLPDILSGIISPDLVALGLSVNGGPEIDISSTSSVPLPAPGPAPVSWSYELTGLTGPEDEVCVTAYAVRETDRVDVTECITLVSNRPPVADAGADQVLPEGAVVALDGSASTDPDGDPLTYRWELVAQDGSPVLLTSQDDPEASFLTFDDGTYELELTVSDGRVESTDRTTVTIENVAPDLTAAAEPATAGGVALLTASYTDPGLLDTHEAVVDWGDGTAPETVDISADGNGWGSLFATHRYVDPGSYTATVTVTDDDGGVDVAQSVEVGVRAPLALWADATDDRRALDWTGGRGTVEGLVHSNDGLRVRGADKALLGPVEVAGRLDLSSNVVVAEPPSVVEPTDPPVQYVAEEYQPGGRAALAVGDAYRFVDDECVDGTWQPAGPLAAGLYVTSCDVHLNSAALQGSLTVVADGSIRVAGSAADFEPYVDGLLFLSGASGDAVTVSSSGGTFFGYVQALAGDVRLAGSGNTYLCGIVADTIRLADSDLLVRASDCTRPGRTDAPPTLVPQLGVQVDIQPEVALPGTPVTTATTVSNDTALLLVPGVVGLENLGEVDVRVEDVLVGIEYRPVGGTWTALDETVELRTTANPDDGVVLPASGGFTDTVVQPGGLATWGVEQQVVLPAATVAFLLDETAVAAVRTVVTPVLDNPTGEPVRSLYRFGDDLAPALRALGGTLTDVQVVTAATDGTATTLTSADEPALAALAPGASTTVERVVPIPVSAPRGLGEPTDVYLDRLASLDGTVLTGSAFALSSGGVGTVLGEFRTDTVTRTLPVVGLTLEADDAVVAGGTAAVAVDVANTGSADALDVVVTVTADRTEVPVTGLPVDLTPGRLASGAGEIAVPADAPTGIVPITALGAWSDAAGNVYGELERRASLQVATPPSLGVLMADDLVVDADGTGLPSPGDTIRYRTTITNRGASPARSVVYVATPDPSSDVVAGTVTTTAGAVVEGDAGGATAVRVDVGEIAPMTSVEITWDALVPGGVTTLSSQAVVSADGLDDVRSDDPGESGTEDPTVTRVVDAPPRLQAAHAGRLLVDADGDGLVGPGDTVEYVVQVGNAGLATASDVVVEIDAPEGGELVVGSLTTDGVVVEGDTPGDTRVVVALGELPGLSDRDLTYEVRVADPLPAGLTELVSQGAVRGAGLDEVPTDDPTVPGADDPTLLAVVTRTGGGGGGGGGGGDGGGGADDGDGSTWGSTGGFTDTTPEAAAEIRVPTTVTTGVQPPVGTTVASWSVVAYPADGNRDAAVPLASGSGEPPADIATVDPSVLANGTWVVRIEIIDSEGGIGVQETPVSVQGSLKLGRFSTTFQDASIRLGGIPLDVRRTYDTTQRVATGDLGYGWTLDVVDFQVTTNRTLGEGPWSVESCGTGFIFVPLCWTPLDGSRVVSVTWPDGRVESFDLRPTGNSFFSLITTIEYAPRPGATSTLRPAPGDESGGFLGGRITDSFASFDVYDPDRFVLVDAEGTEYLLDVRDGLLLATDVNGTTLTYGDDGIVSSLGPALRFERDAEGRITSLVQPDGARVEYVYDAAGDLVSSTDQVGVETTYTYVSGHYLTAVSGPGSPFQRMEYGPDGRVRTITDAAGNTVEVANDLDGRTSQVTSADGRRTLITSYDERGERVRVEDIFDGQRSVTAFEYDEFGNVTRRTDPLGTSFSAEYDDDLNLVNFIDGEGNETRFTYDDRRLPVEQVDALGGTTRIAYDAAGNVSEVVDPEGGVQTFTYDSAGNQTGRTDQVGRSWSWSYGPDGLLSSATDAAGNVRRFEHDATGRLTTETAPDGGITSYAYDAAGNLLSVTDEVGGTTSWTYDEAGLPASATDESGATDTFTHDGNGRLTSRTDATGNTWSYDYAFDRLVAATAPDGGVVTYTYDGSGRLATLTDALGRTSTYTHDPLGRRTSWSLPVGDGDLATTVRAFDGNGDLVGITEPSGATVTYELDPLRRTTAVIDQLGRTTRQSFDANGRVTALVLPSGATTTYDHDDAGQLRSVVAPDGGTTTYAFDDMGAVASITDPLGRTTTLTRDAVGRVTERTLPGGQTERVEYDLSGLPVATTSAAGVTTTMTRDERGLVTAIRDELGNVATSSYDALGQLVAATDPRGATTSYAYDEVGRLVRQTDALGGTVQFGYDLTGRQESVTDPNGATRLVAYDDGGRLIAETDALGRTTEHEVDVTGLRVGTTDARGVELRRSYDLAGQLLSETAGGEVRTYEYDLDGNRTSMTDATGTTTFTHDEVGRLLSVDAPGGLVTYDRNAAGERTAMTQPEGTVSYTYDVNGHLATLTDWRGETAGFDHDADGRVLGVTRANGIDSTYSYDAAGRLVGLLHEGGDGVVDQFDYTLDASGNRTAIDGTRGAEQYVYDPLHRLVAADYGDGTSEAFVYDAAGYRTEHTDVDGVTTGYELDAAGQLLRDSTGVTYDWDPAGNLLGSSDGDSYTWDAWGDLAAATVGGVSQTYAHDADGVRTAVDGFAHVWDRAGGLPTLLSTGDGQDFVHGPTGVLREGEQWLLPDALGSVVAATDAAGDVTSTATYTAYGERRDGSAPSTVFGFAGQQTDETGLLHLRARQYDPSSGRFASVDPLQPGGPGTGGWNLYSYAGDNPVNWSDPSGALVATSYANLLRVGGVGLLLRVVAFNAGVAPAFLVIAAFIVLIAIIIAAVLLLFDPFGAPDPDGDGDPDSPDAPDQPQPGPDTPEPQRPRDPLQDLADEFGVSPDQIRDCLANGLGSAACNGLHDDLIQRIIDRINTGNGRDRCGRFAGGCDFGNEAEQRGLDDYAAETGRDVIPSPPRASHPDVDHQRDFDGLAQKPDGTYEGIEIKSGTATRTPNQQSFDDAVSYGNPATTTVNGQPVQITSVEVRNVP